MYKILTKIVVNRLKPLLLDIISLNQTGFIPSRSIHENIIIAQEIIHSMRKMRGRNGFFFVKVDLMKAYDRLEWAFIHSVLIDIGLPVCMIDFIMHCVSSVRTNVMWNGSRVEFFCPMRGIRQGDPISPHLFVLCIDKLSHLIANAVEDGKWSPFGVGGGSFNFSLNVC